tara:strand:+ start:341 stop:562 length:222 start_codon:yes stop_codon:yes gene_type:complete
VQVVAAAGRGWLNSRDPINGALVIRVAPRRATHASRRQRRVHGRLRIHPPVAVGTDSAGVLAGRVASLAGGGL